MQTDHPSEEKLDAVLLHLRFFTLRKENTSFHHLEKAYSLLLGLPSEVQADFTKAMDTWKNWREMSCGLQGVSNEKLIEVMQYGERVHHNIKATVDLYDDWMATPLLRDIGLPVFCQKVIDQMRVLTPIYHVNKKALAAVL